MPSHHPRSMSGTAAGLCAAAFVSALAHSALAADASPANCSPAPVLQGCGTYAWPDGSKYVGEFKAGYFDGRGAVSFADGSRFEAEFQKGTARGDATYTARDGTRTSGPFHNVGNDKSHPRARPAFPFFRSILGGEGDVLLTVIVAEDGTVTNVQVDDPSAYPTYANAAVAAVRTWKYLPATISGKAVKIPHRVEIKFPEPRG